MKRSASTTWSVLSIQRACAAPAVTRFRWDQAPHDPGRAPIFKYKCRLCGAGYHLFTGTLWSGGHYDLRIVTLLMRGFLQGVPTSHLAEELGRWTAAIC